MTRRLRSYLQAQHAAALSGYIVIVIGVGWGVYLPPCNNLFEIILGGK